MSQYTDFYRQKSVAELLRQLLHHKLEMHTLDKTWHDELVAYLNSLNLQGKSRILFHKISDSNIQQLIADENSIWQDFAAIELEEELANPLEINPKMIREAGKKFKALVYVLIVVVIFNIIMGVVLTMDLYYGAWVKAQTVMVTGSLILSGIMLGLIFSAGSKLEKSVSRKKSSNP